MFKSVPTIVPVATPFASGVAGPPALPFSNSDAAKVITSAFDGLHSVNDKKQSPVIRREALHIEHFFLKSLGCRVDLRISPQFWMGRLGLPFFRAS